MTTIAIVGEARELSAKHQRREITAEEYADQLVELAQRKAAELRRTFTVITYVDGNYVSKWAFATIDQVQAMVRCTHSHNGNRCSASKSLYGDCPSKRLLESIEYVGYGMLTTWDDQGVYMVAAYVNR